MRNVLDKMDYLSKKSKSAQNLLKPLRAYLMERKSYRQLNAKKLVSHAQMMTPLDALTKMNAKKLKMTMNKMLLFVTNQREQAKLKLIQGAKSIKRQMHLNLPSKKKLLTLVSQQWEKIWLLVILLLVM